MEKEKTKIFIASDHVGFEYKTELISFLESKGHTVEDIGTHSKDIVDYPVYAQTLCKKLQETKSGLGILICGSGIGMSIAANKHTGIRAALCYDTHTAQLAREHNDANVLCLGQRLLSLDEALAITDTFLSFSFLGKHHKTRVDMLETYAKL